MVFDLDTMNNAWNGLTALSENCKLGQEGGGGARPHLNELTSLLRQVSVSA